MEKVREHPEMRGVNLHEMKNDDRVRPVPSNALSAWAVSMMKCCAAAGAWAARRASGRGGGSADVQACGGGRAGVQARGALGRRGPACTRAGGLSLRSTLQTCWRWIPVRGGGAHRGPASDRLRYTTVFHPAGRQNVGLSQPLARSGVVPPAGRRVWAHPPPAKPACPQQRRRYPGFASTGACRFIAHVRMGRPAASRG